MPAITHKFVSGVPDDPTPSIIRPSNWDDFHQITYSIDNQSGTTYTLQLTDAYNPVSLTNASPITVAIPTNASVAFPVPTQIPCIQGGAGSLTFTPAGGVTLNGGSASLTFSAVDGVVTLFKVATDAWIAVANVWTAGLTTLALAYSQGTSSANQTLSLSDAAGGGVVVDGSGAGFTGAYSFSVDGSSGVFAVARVGTNVVLTQGVVNAGLPTALTVTGGAHTAITASSEDIGANFNFSATKQWATGLISTQREIVFQAPTYAFVGSSTITNSATVAISGSPIAGVNATLTNPLALWVQNGHSLFAGALAIGSFLTFPASPCMLAVTTAPTVDLSPGSGPGPIYITSGSNNGLNIGIASDNGAWLQNCNVGVGSTAVNVIRLNANGGGVQINSLSPTPSYKPAFFLDISNPVDNTVSTWNGFFVPASNWYYSGASASINVISAMFWSGGVLNYLGGSSLNIVDSYVLRIPALLFNSCTGTRTWSLQIGGNLQLQGGVQYHVKQVTSTPYTVAGQPGGGTTPVSGDYILQVTNAAATTINLPQISVVVGGWVIIIVDSRYNAAVANITLAPNGTDKINNVNANYTMNVNGMSLMLVSNATTSNWEFV